jgi:anti-sigma B factor antagonist
VLRATTRDSMGVTVVDLGGEITLGPGSALLRSTVKQLLADGRKKIVLNLADVDYVDSAGIGELVSGYTSARHQGGEIKLVQLTKRIRDLLQITRLVTVFDVHATEAEAAAAFV